MSDLAALKRQRAAIKASCTRVNTYLDSILAVNPDVIDQVIERKIKLDSYWFEYSRVQTEIEEVDESESNDRVQFEEAFFAISAKIRRLVEPSASIRGSAAPSPSTVQSSGSAEVVSHVRLPKLDLPTFSGNYEEWIRFCSIFNSTIDNSVSLTNTQRFQYLIASLSGEAADEIHALELTDSNYEVAWSLLRARYDNTRVIVYTHLRAIMELPSMSRETLPELRQIAGVSKHLRALKSLKCPTEHWDDVLVYTLSAKLDVNTHREWQKQLTGSQLPTFKQFLEFVNHRCQILESSAKKPAPHMQLRPQPNAKRQAAHVATVKNKCTFCVGEHLIYFCPDFLKLSIDQRCREIQQRKLCNNCLRSKNHQAQNCKSGACKLCQAKHNSLLHAQSEAPSANDGDVASEESPKIPATVATSLFVDKSYVMLSTALVYAYDQAGSRNLDRVLLDCGSQANFISRRTLDMLGLKARRFNVSVSGLNQISTSSTHVARVKIQSRINSFTSELDCIVVDRITDKLPAISMRRDGLTLPPTIKLADPNFYESADIDVLIGADIFWQLLCVGQIRASLSHPTLQKTHFGWILAGRVGCHTSNLANVQNLHIAISNVELHEQLHRFWQLEQFPELTKPLSIDERTCERCFGETTIRDKNGRFIVKLPIREGGLRTLGDSRAIALRRFLALEKRLNRDPELRTQYVAFMHEYKTLGHMKIVNQSLESNESPTFYLPHHSVIKQTAAGSKIRVVFDGSCKSTTGVSLNSVLLVGPVVQQDLISIILRFRTFAYVFTADIVKMYRQILVCSSQTRLQRILWRENSSRELEVYELTTVTYGTASAPYLATKCLQHLAEQEKVRFPKGAQRVLRDFYVDDLLTGADSLQEARTILSEIVDLLKQGSFELGKWASNNVQLLGPSRATAEGGMFDFFKGEHSRILGIIWNSRSDSFHFSVEPNRPHGPISKRVILSEVSKLFDPLGLLGPVVIVAKLLIQEIWQLSLDWDESVPVHIYTRWVHFKEQLGDLNNLTIPRHVKDTVSHRIQVHGFCDASQRAYGACIYFRSSLKDGTFRTQLLCSKSRVAPLKTISLPRLELWAAVLLAQLLEKVGFSIDLAGMHKFLWSDSTITLNWISSSSRKWSVFVANRVGEVQRLTDPKNWRHVSSGDNPADLLSRGIDPGALPAASIWWNGPAFLQDIEERWPKFDFSMSNTDLPEAKGVALIGAVRSDAVFDRLLNRRSHINTIYRVIAYCLRFIARLKKGVSSQSLHISPREMQQAMETLCRSVQSTVFSSEINSLIAKRELSPSSSLAPLSPFLDDQGLLRVEGRLKNSGLSYAGRHPILLPKHHRMTELIISYEHIRNLHAGVQATIAAIRQQFWPLSVRATTRQMVRKCIKCFRAKPVASEAIMGELPSPRVEPSRPFSHCGVDYAGPIFIREGRRRNARNVKAYIAIFVCFATKAIHIEIVSDLTSDAFLGALKRFLSRRGNAVAIYSDNGTAFTGAARQLQEFYDFFKDTQVQAKIHDFLRDSRITWSFIPPNAPHFGGLWEAAVKSAKHHMIRIVGNAHLTYEEMLTVFCEIEAILNSRPITPLSEDPNDLMYLTPGHFLIGEALNSYPCPHISDLSEGRLSRWQRVEQLRQHFWARWSLEYVTQLQERHKWRFNKGQQLQSGQLVFIRQQGLAPLQWLMGRVIKVHTGSDGISYRQDNKGRTRATSHSTSDPTSGKIMYCAFCTIESTAF